MAILVEACVDSLNGALAAARAGAGRLELCAALADGGTTPSAGLIEAVCAAVRIPVMVLVRVRGGDFVYSPSEVDIMKRDAAGAVALGAAGIVVGALMPTGHVDAETTLALVDAASESSVTFHRAVDFTPDPVAALETIAELGVATVLTSGGSQTALQGAPSIARMVARCAAAAAAGLEVMAGGGINEGNVGQILAATGVRAVHVRCSAVRSGLSARGASTRPAIRLRKALPADESAWEDSDEGRIREVVIAARSAPS